VISFIVAPANSPQIAPPKPPAPAPPQLDRLDKRLLEQLGDAGACPTWTLLDMVAEEQAPCDRTAGRLLRLELLGRLKRLRRLGLAFPVGRNWISASKPDPAMRQSAVRRRRRTVRELCVCFVPSVPGQHWGSKRQGTQRIHLISKWIRCLLPQAHDQWMPSKPRAFQHPNSCPPPRGNWQHYHDVERDDGLAGSARTCAPTATCASRFPAANGFSFLAFCVVGLFSPANPTGLGAIPLASV
jgi:hypothetical protein